MATFVLVHGGWCGGWIWRPMKKLLLAAGHRVHTPTLTGLGERSHLQSTDIDLNVHIADVENLVKWEDLSDIRLVGHSYGGFVITGVASRMPDAIWKLVYIDAYTIDNGQCPFDVMHGAQNLVDKAEKKRRRYGRTARCFSY